MNAEQKQRDVAITSLIEAGVITEDDAYPSNDINECYAAQDALIAAHADQRNEGVTNMTTVAYAVVVEHANGKVEYVGPFAAQEVAEDWAHNNKPTWLDWVHTIPLTAATSWLVVGE